MNISKNSIKLKELYTIFPSEVLFEMGLPSYLEGNFLSRMMTWGKLKIITKYASEKKGKTALDFGCGCGIISKEISAYYDNIIATDLHNEVAIHLIKSYGIENVSFINPNAINDISSDSIDCIIAANVLEHLDNLHEMIRLFKRILRKDGKLIISGPTENRLYRRGRSIIGFSGEYHQRNIEDIFLVVRSCGLTNLNIHQWPAPGPLCLYKIAVFSQISEKMKES